MPISFGGKPCLDTTQLRDECLRRGLPVDWVGKANRYTTTVSAGGSWGSGGQATGNNPGMAQLVMLRSDVDALDKNALNDLVLHDGTTQITIKNLLFVSSKCLTPGYPNDPNSAHLVEAADVRYLAWNKYYGHLLYKSYDLLSLGDLHTYSPDTSISSGPLIGQPFNWQLLFDDIWSEIQVSELGSSPTLPYTPNGKPENMVFTGIPAFSVYTGLLFEVACGLAHDPLTGTFSIFRYGDADSSFETLFTGSVGRRLFDDEPQEGTRAKFPKTVTVSFRIHTTNSDATVTALNRMHVITVNGSTYVDTSASETDSSAEIFEDLFAIEATDGTITNLPDLQTKATERAARYYGTLDTKLHVTYSGLIPFKVGSKCFAVSWGDTGAGMVTEIARAPASLSPGTGILKGGNGLGPSYLFSEALAYWWQFIYAPYFGGPYGPGGGDSISGGAGADWMAFKQQDGVNSQVTTPSGLLSQIQNPRWYTAPLINTAAQAGTAVTLTENIRYMIPFISGRIGTISALAFYLQTTAIPSAVAEVAILKSVSTASIFPTLPLFTFQNVPLDTTGFRELTFASVAILNRPVAPGTLYWLSLKWTKTFPSLTQNPQFASLPVSSIASLLGSQQVGNAGPWLPGVAVYQDTATGFFQVVHVGDSGPQNFPLVWVTYAT